MTFAGVPGFPAGPIVSVTRAPHGNQSAGRQGPSMSPTTTDTRSRRARGPALTLGRCPAGAAITVLGGSHTISAPLVMTGNGPARTPPRNLAATLRRGHRVDDRYVADPERQRASVSSAAWATIPELRSVSGGTLQINHGRPTARHAKSMWASRCRRQRGSDGRDECGVQPVHAGTRATTARIT